MDQRRDPRPLIHAQSYLPLPWTLSQPVQEFDESAVLRKDWDADEEFYVGQPEVDLDTFEKMMGTGSAVTRWCQAHLDAVGTENDMVRMLRRDIERLLHEVGVEKGKERMKGVVQGTLLMVKRRCNLSANSLSVFLKALLDGDAN